MITSVTINSLITFPYADFLRDGIITDSNNSVGTKSIPEQTHTVFSEIERLQDHAGPYLDDMGRYLRNGVLKLILELESHCMQDGTSDPLADIVMADITEITYYMIEKIRMNIRQVKERSNRGKLFDALSSFKTPFLFKQSKKMSTQTVGRNVKIYATLV
ncbi:unnamed protein product [Fasciola hepatica]|uniref:Uncharacterized protein n=1 Tax=Fasciola hepatica TaxID=6192 RepID=A0ABC9HGU7_FASHE